MEEALSLLAGLLSQVLTLGLIVWVVVRLVDRRRPDGARADQAASVRRVFTYGLLFATLMLASTGLALALQELAEAAAGHAGDDRSTLALGLAMVVVAGPAYGLLLRHVLLDLKEHTAESQSFSWAAYLNLSLLVSLVVTTVATQQLLEGIAGVDDFGAELVAPPIVWGAVWAAHWFWLRAAHGLPGDVHLAAGSLTGLITLAIGVGGLTFVAGDEIYTSIVDRVPDGHPEAEVRTWAIATAIGALVWWWHWLCRYLSAERTAVWHIYVVLVGVLGGLVAAVVSAATIGYWTLVWYLGDPESPLPSEHFEFVAVSTAILVVGVASWQYHRRVLQRHREVERTEPLRTYDYLVAASGLVAVVVAATLTLTALIEALTPEPAGAETEIANRLILAIVLAVIGVPLWWHFWSSIQAHLRVDPAAELGSAVRRVYLVVLFGIGGLVVLGGLIAVLFVGFEDLLDGTFGGATVRSFRVGLSLVITVAGVAWYHLGVLRSDRLALAALRPERPAPPTRHVVLVGPRDAGLAEELASATGAYLEAWNRTDITTPPETDIGELAAAINATGASDVLVILGSGGPEVVPFESPRGTVVSAGGDGPAPPPPG